MSEDFDKASELFRFLNSKSDEMSFLVIPGNPWSKSRPRFARNGSAYQPKDDSEHEQRTGLWMRRLRTKYTGNVAVGAIFYRGDRQRIDSDNLMKHICDSGNGVLWDDDSQVTAQIGVIEYDPSHPRTVLVVAKHESSMKRGTDWTYTCEECAVEFPMLGKTESQRPKRCPEHRTNSKFGTKLTVRTCPSCGSEFKASATREQRYCSVQCVPRKGLPKRGKK